MGKKEKIATRDINPFWGERGRESETMRAGPVKAVRPLIPLVEAI